jgi:hypothetical protein
MKEKRRKFSTNTSTSVDYFQEPIGMLVQTSLAALQDGMIGFQ